MATNPLTPRVNNIETGGTWKIGDVKQSFLTEAEFQAEHDDTWVLCDGRDVIGSDYAILKEGDAVTSHNIPDARGQFLRGKDYGRHLIDGKGNPGGDLALGDYQADQFKSHRHSYTDNTGSGGGSGPSRNQGEGTRYTAYTGGDETRPKSVTCNMFIKINREPSA